MQRTVTRLLFTHRDRKAVINTTLPVYAPTPGPLDFRIEGYTSAGVKVAAADDTITLYIDNPTSSNPDFDIDSVSMGVQNGGDCALFNLGGSPNLPLTVRFHANQTEHFMDSYALSVRTGGKTTCSEDREYSLPHVDRATVWAGILLRRERRGAEGHCDR